MILFYCESPFASWRTTTINIEVQSRGVEEAEDKEDRSREPPGRRRRWGWRLIFCSLASASSSATGRPHFAQAVKRGSEGEKSHPSSCPLRLLSPALQDRRVCSHRVERNTVLAIISLIVSKRGFTRDLFISQCENTLRCIRSPR